MKRIEFIGAPAIGKSSVLNEVIKMRSPAESWVTTEEARIHLAGTIELDKNLFQRLLQIYLKQNVIKRFKNSVAANILNKRYRNLVLVRMHEKYSDIADLFMERIINDKINSLHKLELTSFYYNLLVNDVMFFDYFKLNHIIVYDEGIIQNSGFRGEEESSVVLKNHINNQTGVIPAGIIYCYMTGEEYFNRRKERIIHGRRIYSDRTLNDNELKSLCYRSLKAAEDKGKVLKNHGVPILELDMGNSVIHNAEKAHEFIKRFQCDAACRTK